MSYNSQSLQILAQYLAPRLRPTLSLADFARQKFYVADTQQPIELMPHQLSILNYALDNDFRTIIYSTIKKSGKTTIAALVGRYVAETRGPFTEVILVANDYEQARGRVYQKIVESISLDPRFVRSRNELPGEWKIIERVLKHIPTNSTIRAISSDYAGEAGANPTATIWSELWGFSRESLHRLWDELTPVPTKPRSFRFVETYAGFEDESDLLLSLYNLGLKGVRLTHDDLLWPFEDQPPIWVNKQANLLMYWDSGPAARRMPWQTPQYYTEQAASLRPAAFDRLHNNYWTTSVSAFTPVEWWDACMDPLPPLDSKTPVVVGVDAAVSSDCCAMVAVSRHPQHSDHVCERLSRIWTPQPGQPIDLDATIGATLDDWANRYNICLLYTSPSPRDS